MDQIGPLVEHQFSVCIVIHCMKKPNKKMIKKNFLKKKSRPHRAIVLEVNTIFFFTTGTVAYSTTYNLTLNFLFFSVVLWKSQDYGGTIACESATPAITNNRNYAQQTLNHAISYSA